MVYIVLSLLSSAMLILFSKDITYNMIKRTGPLILNYKGRRIPTALGIILLPATSLSISFLYFFPTTNKTHLTAFLLLLYGMAFIGLTDDLLGERQVKGIKAHLIQLMSGHMTTGAFKALLGIGIALLACLSIYSDIYALALNVFIIALSANFMNLFDLRPGRCLKVFWLMVAIAVVFAPGHIGSILFILPLIIASMVYFPLDASEAGMLGDTGANMLGAAVGWAIVVSWPQSYKYIYLMGLVMAHLLAEHYSFSALIEHSRVLSMIDRMGRER
ncbi:MAG: hypothetical protein PWP48_1382 [Clostridiales bacterium]|nr:hypothetical protein [Clostridiales bacterium]MDK2992149.1 hypothetical protein [Clostridiales bacterium]